LAVSRGGETANRLYNKGAEMMALKRINVKIAEDMHEWLKGEAEKRGLTMNAIVIFALEQYYQQMMLTPHINALKELKELADKK